MNVVKNKLFASQLLGMFQDRSSAFLFLRLEQNGSLLDFINRSGKIPLDCAQKITTEIVLGLQHLHVNNIIHEDMKPENVLLDSNLRAHVADFGMSIRIKPNTLLYDKWGTREYQSPEQLVPNVTWDHRVDNFNVGVILLIMITGFHPFGKHLTQIQENCRKLAFLMPPLTDANAVSFIQRTVCHQDDRLNLISIRKHPFIASIEERIINSYVPAADAIYCEEKPIKPFYDGINFFSNVPGIPLDKVEKERLVPSHVS